MDYVIGNPGTPLPPERVILHWFEVPPQSKEFQIRDNGNSWSLRGPRSASRTTTRGFVDTATNLRPAATRQPTGEGRIHPNRRTNRLLPAALLRRLHKKPQSLHKKG